MKYMFIVCVFLFSLFANELKYETSPYLQQHATNPVNWLPWGEKAFAKAKKENKPVFLSIGYSTCHWCHVMAKESFENAEIAKLFNKYFICIKVDREEMPHLDSYYQQVYQKVKKHSGGWPLSIFLSYDKKPFYIATYIPSKKQSYHEGLDTLLPRINQEYRSDYASIMKRIETIESIMSKPLEVAKNKNNDISVKTLVDALNKDYDEIYSGFSRNKKFPEASKLALMMDLALIEQNKDLEEKSLKMLDTMALRGLYDHVEGGFFRYAVDAAWEIPHFEKMLYNQAELIPLYVRAYLLTNKKLYKDVVVETINMLDKRFVKNNLYYSASDADTHHKEGDFFLFSTQNIKDALQNNPHAKEIKDALEFTMYGNFEGNVHLNFYTKNRPKGFVQFRNALVKIRDKKEYPFIDKKINTAWNSMMIEALYSASLIDEKYLQKANNHLKALKEFMFDKGELYHQSLLGLKPQQLGLLEDYSFFISALISGYEADYDESKLVFAEYLLVKALRKFHKKNTWYLSDDDLKIRADLKDKYYTSAVARMTQNLIKMASLKSSFKYEKIAIITLKARKSEIQRNQSDVPASAIAFLMQKINVVTLKNSKETLLKNRVKIKKIKYPYILTEAQKLNEYMVCTMRSCFAKDKDLQSIKKNILLNIRN